MYTDDGSSIRAYKDGALLSGFGSSSTTNTSIQYIGGRPSWGTNGLGGGLDEFFVLNRVMSGSEASALYNQTAVNGEQFRYR